MIELPAQLGGKDLLGWRIDHDQFKANWDSGIGAYEKGGRWNSAGTYAVYASLDPATAILEVAVHKTFRVLDTVPHALTSFTIKDAADIHVVMPADVPNPNWLVPGIPSAGQQSFGSDLLAKHRFVLIPSVVSRHSWNLVFDAVYAKGAYAFRHQERLAIDTRLNAP
jgi:RES domain-containing protein